MCGTNGEVDNDVFAPLSVNLLARLICSGRSQDMPNQDKARDQELDQVELIASGYEWTCPNCNNLNDD